MQNLRDRAVQQRLVMANNQHCVRIARQILLQPNRPFEVKIVCWLVEQQEIRLREQHRRQSHSHSPTTGKVRARLLLRIIIKAQTMQNAGRAGLGRMGFDVRKTHIDVRNAGRVSSSLGFSQQISAFNIRR